MQQLVDVVETRLIGADIGYAVTPALREWYVEGDEEELEYVAMTAAAAAALHLLASRPDDIPRRVVLAVEIPEAAARPAPHVARAAVAMSPASLDDVVSAHVDGAEAEADVRAAVAALPAAAEGDEEAKFVVDAAEDHELAWYAAQEIPALVAVEGDPAAPT